MVSCHFSRKLSVSCALHHILSMLHWHCSDESTNCVLLSCLLRCWFVGTTKAMWTWQRSTTSCLCSCSTKRRGSSAPCCHMAVFTLCGSSTATSSVSFSHMLLTLTSYLSSLTTSYLVIYNNRDIHQQNPIHNMILHHYCVNYSLTSSVQWWPLQTRTQMHPLCTLSYTS